MKKTTLYPIMIILLAALAFAQGVTHDPSEITPGIYGGGSTEAYSYNSMVIANQGVQAYPNSGSSYAIYGRGDGNGLGYVGYGRAGIYGYGMATGRWGAGMTAFNANDVGTGVFSYVSGTGSYGYRAESPAGATGTSGMRIDIMASNANGVDRGGGGRDS